MQNMEFTNFLCAPAFMAVFIYLFFREVKKDRKAELRADVEGDLHILREMRKFYVEIGKDTKEMDEAIEEMGEKLKRIK